MKYKSLLLSLIWLTIFSCSAPRTDSKVTTSQVSKEWELQIVDSIQVDYMGRIWESNFKNGFGYLRDIASNSLVKFDTTGAIIAQQTYPEDGPGMVKWFSGLTISDQNELYAFNYVKDIYHFGEDLKLIESFEMPFNNESGGGRRNSKVLSVWENKLLLWFPGRDGNNPFMDHFFRDHPLLELFDPQTQTTDSLIRLPKISKFNSELFFERPDVQFSVSDDFLYLSLSNESLIHKYSLAEGGKYLETLDFHPEEFQLVPGQKVPVDYISGNTMYEASIEGIYSTKDHIIVSYSGGIAENIFKQFELNKSENFYKYPDYRKNFLRIYSSDAGWSNEIKIPTAVDMILNIESPTQAFYALRNDDYLGEEQDYLTFYKLQLVQK